jgi:hypothetical protein
MTCVVGSLPGRCNSRNVPVDAYMQQWQLLLQEEAPHRQFELHLRAVWYLCDTVYEKRVLARVRGFCNECGGPARAALLTSHTAVLVFHPLHRSMQYLQ